MWPNELECSKSSPQNSASAFRGRTCKLQKYKSRAAYADWRFSVYSLSVEYHLMVDLYYHPIILTWSLFSHFFRC
jgi:hypothetical protein